MPNPPAHHESVQLVRDWWPLGIVLALGGMAATDMAGRLDPIAEHLTTRTSDFWSAAAAWVAVLVGVITIAVAGRYAKQQVEKAQEQIREAQEARLDQERQARQAIETQLKIAAEQAQPNVVLFTELHPQVKQYIEVVIKNFGTTPAYNVRAVISPALKATPNLISSGVAADVTVPEFPILAPGQEWRTGWDHSVARKRHNKKWQPLAGKSESELTDQQKIEVQAHIATIHGNKSIEQAIAEMVLPSRHTATVYYNDSQGTKFATTATLDPDVFEGTTWVDIKTVHDLTKMLEKQLGEQGKGLAAIHRRLAEFGTEHDGIWIYNSSDDEERQYRRAMSAAQKRELHESRDHLEWQLSGRNGEDPTRRITTEEITTASVENAVVGDWYVSAAEETPAIGQAWRIDFIRHHTYEDFGTVVELFRSDGESIREREGTHIRIVRA